MTVTDLISRLDGAKRNGNGWTARCPAHDDREPSLSVSMGGDGRTLLHCHAGCSTDAVVGALGLTMSDLYADSGTSHRNGKREIVAEYDYTNEGGELLFQVLRYFPKDFRQRRPDGRGGWTWGRGDAPPVLYRLPEVMAAVALGKPVWICEGEEDVHALESLRAVATCNAGGAKKWRDEYAESLRNAVVRIVADKDAPGREHAEAVARALKGVAESVELLEAAEGKDAADHIDAGHGLDHFRPMGVELESFTLLADLLERPELLKPPRCDLPRLGYRGRCVALAGPDKSGKSTLLAHGAAAMSRGIPFLGERCDAGNVAWVGLEEAAGDAVRRFNGLAADGSRIQRLPSLSGLPPRNRARHTCGRAREALFE